MGHPYHHALSSAKKWGGTADDYLALHQWFDESKAITADFRHRALRHHAEGIFMLVIWTCKLIVSALPMRNRPADALNPKSWRRSACSSHREAMPFRRLTPLH